jgi:hypothetical protein
MTGDGKKAAEVLARAQRAWSPGPADAERVRRSIGVALASGATGSLPDAVPRAPRWTARLLAAGTIAVAGGGIGYWAGYRAGIRDTALVARVAPSPLSDRPTVPAPLPATPEPQPSALSSAPTGVRHGGHSAHHDGETAAPSVAESLAVELRGLRNTERALRDGNPGLALAFLSDLDRQVPHGQLGEEREAMSTLARCARGDRPIGVDLGGEFIERHPTSVYRARVEQACSATDSSRTGDSWPRRSPE